ncbi:hypothetical protein HK101_003258, partial [Irineochytrium annulatum]
MSAIAPSLNLTTAWSLNMTLLSESDPASLFRSPAWVATDSLSATSALSFNASVVPRDNADGDPESLAIRVNYPAGTFAGPGQLGPGGKVGGVSVYEMPLGYQTQAARALLEYSVYFPPSFDWVQGGKLPGLYGHAGQPGQSRECRGGLQSDGSNCWSVRLMWRTNGAAEAYCYLPMTNQQQLCSQHEFRCDSSYGLSISRGAFSFVAGKWNHVGVYVETNNPSGSATGSLSVYLNGQRAIHAPSLIFRDGPLGDGDLLVRNLFFSTFFGGNDSTYAPPADTFAMFGDMSLSVGGSVPGG